MSSPKFIHYLTPEQGFLKKTLTQKAKRSLPILIPQMVAGWRRVKPRIYVEAHSIQEPARRAPSLTERSRLFPVPPIISTARGPNGSFMPNDLPRRRFQVAIWLCCEARVGEVQTFPVASRTERRSTGCSSTPWPTQWARTSDSSASRRGGCTEDVHDRVLGSLSLFRIMIVAKDPTMMKDGKNVVRIHDASKSAGFLELK